ncbi:hypothetical protein [Lyngbya aestuarii]|uniref:hypothetical protein n=1 Tax=Lyngbya aestuarii TaxID=118322 RepID=UPI00403DDDF7
MADLSGTWLGTYWQQGVPTRFELTLLQGSNALSGSILDENHLGEASLTGEVIGRRINFDKRYITGNRHSVSYTGTVSEDEDFMQGRWQINLFDSGNWEARRSDENLTINLENRRAEQVPAGNLL